MQTHIWRKQLILGIIFLFIGGRVISVAFNNNENKDRDIIYINWDGTGDYTTIQEGINAANPGDTVFVFNGIYYEHISINKQLFLIGEDKNTTIIDGSNSGHIVDVSVDSVNISHFTIQNAGESTYIAAIHLTSNNNIIFDNNLLFSRWNMFLQGSSGNTISYNYFKYTGHSENIRFESSCNNNWFHNNTLFYCGIRTLYDCDYNIFEYNNWEQGWLSFNPDGHYNTVRYNYFGTGAGCSPSQRSHNNEIYKNTFVNGGFSIVDYQASYGNIIWHNNFINCSINIKFEDNYMYNPTLEEGNYWSNHAGIDSDGDGIGDTPYSVPGDADAQDLYPLMYPYGREPVAHWRFDEGSGTIAHDYTKNDNDGTIYGAIWTSGINGYALSFDGHSDYVKIPNYSSIQFADDNKISIEFWVKWDGTINPYHVQGLVDKQYIGGFDVVLLTNSSNFEFRICNELTSSVVNSNYHLDTYWHHIACIWDGINQSIYIDGHLDNSTIVQDFYISDYPKYLEIGNRWYGDDFSTFNGIIDEVCLYNHALSSYEILAHYEKYLPLDIVYVDDDYDETTPGWWIDHFNSIQDGIDAVDENGTVYVNNGTYYENVVVEKSISLSGDDRSNTIINGGGSGDVVIVSADLVNISGFSMVNGGSSIWNDAGLDVSHSSYCKVENCLFFNNLFTGIRLESVSNCQIFNIKCYNNSHIGIYTRYSSDVQIINCKLCNNNGNGMRIDHYSNHFMIANCSVSYNSEGIQLLQNANQNIIVNCSSYNNSANGIQLHESANSNKIYHCNLFNNTKNAFCDDLSNCWYNETLGEGNYYDDYMGDDNDGNGIGDTPYNISGGNNQDLYPLMYPFGQGPIAHWRFNEGTADLLHDCTGNNYNGMIYGANWTTGLNGSALEFDGEDDYINISNSTEMIYASMTVCAWVKKYVNPSEHSHIISKHQQYDTSGWILEAQNNKFAWYTGFNSPTNYIITPEDYDSKWHFLVGIYDNGIGRLYVDNVFKGSNNGNMLPNSYSVNIGRVHPVDNAFNWYGVIDEVSIYNRALDEDEIQTLYEYNRPVSDIVYIDDDYNETTPGWGYDHFDSIQNGIYAVEEDGTVYVYNGFYEEQIIVDKSVILEGESNISTDVVGGFNVSADNITIKYFNISGGFEWDPDGEGLNGANKAGIYTSSSNNTFINNQFWNINGEEGESYIQGIIGGDGGTSTGIYLYYSNYNNIYLNNIYDINGGDGGSANRLAGDGGFGTGIYLQCSIDNNITANNFSNINGGNGGSDADSHIGSGGFGTGIYIHSSTENHFFHNNFNKITGGNGGDASGGGPGGMAAGMYLYSSILNHISFNKVSNVNGGSGGGSLEGPGGLGISIYLDESSYNNVNSNTVLDIKGGSSSASYGSGGSGMGIYLHSSPSNNITLNIVSDVAGGTGGDFGGSSGSGMGIYLHSSPSNNITLNIINNVAGGTSCVDDWCFCGSAIGIYLDVSSDNNISFNKANNIYGGNGTGCSSGGVGSGIYLKYSINNTLYHNNVSNVNGGDGDSEFFCGFGGNGNAATGIYLDVSLDNNITQNIVYNINGGDGGFGNGYGGHGGDGIGIYLYSSTSDYIILNLISNITAGNGGSCNGVDGGDGGSGMGICINFSTASNITFNDLIHVAGGTGGMGGDWGSDGADGIGAGFYSFCSSNNTITSCKIYDNEYGFSFYQSFNNLIYNNNISNNINKSFDDGYNIWNITKTIGTNIIGGPYLGGNYWSDYHGRDLDGDLIGDTNLPHNCSGEIQNGGDFLPLTPIFDLIPPEIQDNTPSIGYTSHEFTFNATITDDNPITEAWIEYWNSSDVHINLSMNHISYDYWEKTIIIYSVIEPFNYIISAKDSTYNWNNTSIKEVEIYDIDGPVIYDNTPDTCSTGDSFIFNANVIDYVNLSDVFVEYWYGSGSHVNESMVYVGGNYWEKTIIIDDTLEVLYYIISANDTSNNWNNTGVKEVLIFDNDNPEIDNVNADPPEQFRGYFINVSATVTDNIEVEEVYLYLVYPDISTDNINITNNNIDDTYFLNTTFDMPGVYTYHMWTDDTSGNENVSGDYNFEIINQPPYVPSSPDPYDGELDVSIDTDLSWIGGDPELDPVTFDVYFGTSSPPLKVVSNQSANIYSPGTLEYYTTYYWKIVSWDIYDAFIESTIWSFITEEEFIPEPDLDCYGDLNWGDVETGSTITGTIYVVNNGDPMTLLDWEIESYPEWGTWSFNPDSGTGLTPENSPQNIEVSVVAPDEQNEDFIGQIKIVNTQNLSDNCIVDVSLATPVSQDLIESQNLFYRSFIERFMFGVII